MYKVLVCDDEKDIVSAISIYLTSDGYEVIPARNGLEALDIVKHNDVHLVLMDIMMPVMDGIEAMVEIRKISNVPVILLTAKSEDTDKILGLNVGADDYLPKPFEPDELIARVRAMLRRSEDYHPTLLTWGDITLNPDTGVLSCGRESVRLSGREFQVMELFMRSPKVVLSADRIMERVWGWDSDAEINVVWVHISNLRKKIKSIGSGVTITANRGMGYLLEETK